MVSPLLLRPNPWNTNIVSPDNEEKLALSISHFGLFKPIVVRDLPGDDGTEYEILGGEHRWGAAVNAKLHEIPIFSVGEIDDDTAKKISLADNARYGADDTIELAKLLEGLHDAAQLNEILPWSASDISAIFSSVDIALEELDIGEGFEEEEAPAPSDKAAAAPKTHTIMRFKVQLEDAERVTELVAKIKKRQNFTTSDDLTNAGDALVHALFATAEA
jgi:ParB-like chromosome segregation protein Spo0J